MSQLDRLNCCFVKRVGRKQVVGFFFPLCKISILSEIKLFSLFFFFFPSLTNCPPKPQVSHKILHLVKPYNLVSGNIWGNPQRTVISYYYPFLRLLCWYVYLFLYLLTQVPPVLLELWPQTLPTQEALCSQQEVTMPSTHRSYSGNQ